MLSQQALDEVLEQQSSDGRRLGTLLVERGLINETQLTQILSHQLSVPWVALLHIEFSRQLLNLVPLEIAEKYCLVPIYVRHVRGQGDTLYVAMDDPTNEEPLRECMKYSGLPVRPMIAPPSDIREAIRVCYGVDIESPHSKAALAKASKPKPSEPTLATELPKAAEAANPAPSPAASSASKQEPSISPPSDIGRDMGMEATMVSPVMAEAPTTPRVAAAQAVAAPARDAGISVVAAPALELTAAAPEPVPAAEPSSARTVPYDDTPVVEAVEIEIPRSRRARALEQTASAESGPSSRRGPRSQRMISVTLLDGTTLAVPAQPGRGASVPADEAPSEAPAPAESAVPGNAAVASVGEIISALRAAVRADPKAAGATENARTGIILAAVLSVLVKKHLITEREILDELSRE